MSGVGIRRPEPAARARDFAPPARAAGFGRALVFFIVLLSCPSACFAQADRIIDEVKEKRRKEILEGTEAFRRLLFDEQLAPLGDLTDLEEQPENKILIVLGNLDVLDKRLTGFVRNGGAVLLASDRPLGSPVAQQQLRTLAGVSIGRNTLVCVQAESCYKGLFWCPFVVPSADGRPDLFSDPSTGRSREVATNVPSWLVSERQIDRIRPIATLPNGCHPDRDGFRFRGRRGERPLFAVAGDFGKGRVLVMADHSVFINEMMLPTDNGNFFFASNAVAWLRGEDSRRTQVLFMDERGIQTKFEIPLKSINIPPEEAMRLLFANRNEVLAAGENMLGRLEAEGAFDRGLMNVFERVGLRPGRLGRAALVALTTLFGLYALYRVGFRHRFRHDPTAPLLATALDRNLPVAALAEQRHATLLAGGNFAEPAMHLARQWFARLGVDSFGGAMPGLESRGGWWHRRRSSARLRGVWRLAAGQGGRVTPRRLEALERVLAELRAAHERGEWRLSALSPPSPPGRIGRGVGGEGEHQAQEDPSPLSPEYRGEGDQK